MKKAEITLKMNLISALLALSLACANALRPSAPRTREALSQTRRGWLLGAAAGALVVALCLALFLSWLNQPPAGVTTKAGFDEVELPATVQIDNGDSVAVNENTWLSISVLPENMNYEVFVDGKFVKRGPVVKMEVTPGTHEVTVTSKSGSQKRFTVVVPDGGHLERIWDFERNRWRR